MSRKPVVVSLDDAVSNSTENPKTQAKKKIPADPGSRTKKSAKSLSPRKPQVMDAPDPSESVDVFDADSDTYIGTNPSQASYRLRRGRWGLLFAACITTLFSLGIGLWFIQVIEGLFATNEWLGWAASVLLAIALISLIVILFREIIALLRLRILGKIREDVMRVMEDETKSSQKVLTQIVSLYETRKEMEWHIARLANHAADVMDNRDRLLIAERTLMKPLDDEAKQIIATAAKRVSVVTAVNPAASLDVIFTGYQVLRMLRQLTALYGNRPGSIGTIRLATMVGSHLAVTGGLALSDTLIQQFIGKGLAGRLSAKLGEGTVNGILTSRIGLAAMDLCRPMPFNALERPGLKQFIATIAGPLTGYTKDQEGS